MTRLAEEQTKAEVSRLEKFFNLLYTPFSPT
jgi:hypothetical protein